MKHFSFSFSQSDKTVESNRQYWLPRTLGRAADQTPRSSNWTGSTSPLNRTSCVHHLWQSRRRLSVFYFGNSHYLMFPLQMICLQSTLDCFTILTIKPASATKQVDQKWNVSREMAFSAKMLCECWLLNNVDQIC